METLERDCGHVNVFPQTSTSVWIPLTAAVNLVSRHFSGGEYIRVALKKSEKGTICPVGPRVRSIRLLCGKKTERTYSKAHIKKIDF